MRCIVKLNIRYLAVICLTIVLIVSCSEDSNSPNDPGITNDIEIGVVSFNPNGIIVNTNSEITVKLIVPPGVEILDSTLQLIKLNETNNTSESVGLLADNGNTFNGDEIAGDNVFSGIITIQETTVGSIVLQVTGKAKSGETQGNGVSEKSTLMVFSNLTSNENNEINVTQQEAVQKFEDFLGGNVSNAGSAISQTVQWLETQPQVEQVENGGNTSIQIKYKSGLYGGVIFSFKDVNGTVLTRGGFNDKQDRKKNKRIPIAHQSRGQLNQVNSLSKGPFSITDLDPNVIGNRNVLIYAPYEAAFAPYNERNSIKTILQSTDFEFSVTEYVNQAATVAALNNLTDYGFIVLATHGSLGKEFATGEVVDTNASNYSALNVLRKAGSLATWDNVTISSAGGVDKNETVYVIRAKFISDLAGKFPNSVILNNSCESTMNDDLYNSFKAKGAKAYFGYSKVVNSDFCVAIADTVTKRLAKDLKNSGETYFNASDPNSPFAHFEIRGENDIHYNLELINGDFEFGNLNGWTKDGDGRLINKLESVNPTGGSYMGIISTGLGFTTATGSIFQTFRVENNQSKLNVKWNFLSEEFLEFINSSFQDFFRVVIKKKDGTEIELLNKSIDDIASEFGAKKFNNEEGEVPQPGNLISVSPQIKFDIGDVYMTGWQTTSFDISAYQGEIITIIFKAGDVGDSIYDTAILLDDISIQ